MPSLMINCSYTAIGDFYYTFKNRLMRSFRFQTFYKCFNLRNISIDSNTFLNCSEISLSRFSISNDEVNSPFSDNDNHKCDKKTWNQILIIARWCYHIRNWNHFNILKKMLKLWMIITLIPSHLMILNAQLILINIITALIVFYIFIMLKNIAFHVIFHSIVLTDINLIQKY